MQFSFPWCWWDFNARNYDRAVPSRFRPTLSLCAGVCWANRSHWSWRSPDAFRAQLAPHLAKLVVDDPLFATAAENPPFDPVEAGLSDQARTLLKHAVDGDGHIVIASDMDGGNVEAGNKNFVTPGSTRSFAEWRGALNDLVELSYAEDLGEGSVFRITREGFAAADQF